MDNDHVSIIFTHYAMSEERSTLARASLKSLQGTIHNPAEIIVVDNGNNEEDSQFFIKQCQEKKIALYIRNSDNMQFSFARNQAMMQSTGKWIAIVDNDIMYKDKWLELCLWLLAKSAPEKRIASPINYPYVHKRDPRWRHGQVEYKGRQFNLTERAGSNCMVMRRETMLEAGFFMLDKKAGSYYTDTLVRLGYLVLTPESNWAFDAGLRRGFNFNADYSVDRTLTDGTKINFQEFKKSEI